MPGAQKGMANLIKLQFFKKGINMKSLNDPEPLENFLIETDQQQKELPQGITLDTDQDEILKPVVKDKENKFVLKVSIKDFSAPSLHLVLFKNILWINATHYTFKKVFFGLFKIIDDCDFLQRPIILPPYIHHINATCKEGVLTINLFKQTNYFGGKVVPIKPKSCPSSPSPSLFNFQSIWKNIVSFFKL
jgi:HSP20 family molecular chaperone IbpA